MLVWRLRKKDFIEKFSFFLVSSKGFKPKKLATNDLTLPNCLEKELVIQKLF